MKAWVSSRKTEREGELYKGRERVRAIEVVLAIEKERKRWKKGGRSEKFEHLS